MSETLTVTQPIITQQDRQMVARIKTLHTVFTNSYRQTVESSAEIGELLLNKKKDLKHGEWQSWLKASEIPFCDRTARNYITIYRNKQRLKLANVSNIHKALTVLRDSIDSDRTTKREMTRSYRKAFAKLDLPYKNPPKGHYKNEIIAGNNLDVLPEMLKYGMAGKYDIILTSPPYNRGFIYSDDHNDEKAPQKYFEELIKPFKYYPQLLKKGGRVIYVIADILPNPDRDNGGDYIYDIPYELRKRVEQVAPQLRYFGRAVWEKGAVGKCPLKNNWGTFCSPEEPVLRECHESILVWSNEEFSLKKPSGGKIDIDEDEFKEFAWSIWNVSPHVVKYNPHPASYCYQLIERILKFWSYQGSNILDCYHGVGVTAKVCQNLKRNFTGVELNKAFCAFALKLLASKNNHVSDKDMRDLLKGHEDVLKMIGL